MRLTSKGQYALVGILDVLNNSNGSPVSLQDISDRQTISLNYLEQLFKKLREAELVTSTRGPGGGYMVKGSPKDITVLKVLKSVGEDVASHQIQLKKTKEQQTLYYLFGLLENTVQIELNTSIQELSQYNTK